MNEEFNAWVARSIPPHKPMPQDELFYIRAEWFASAIQADKMNADRINELEEELTKISMYAHDNSTWPAVKDHLWEIRQIAYDTL